MNHPRHSPVTHWCRNCDAHFRLDQVRQYIAAPEAVSGEIEVLQCPSCNSYYIEPLVEIDAENQHCTVVFRIPGPREALGDFLTELCTKFPARQPEIIAFKAGNALRQRENGK